MPPGSSSARVSLGFKFAGSGRDARSQMAPKQHRDVILREQCPVVWAEENLRH